MSRNSNHDDKKSAGIREKCGGKFSRQELISIFSSPQEVVVTNNGHDCTTSSFSSQQDTQQAFRKK